MKQQPQTSYEKTRKMFVKANLIHDEIIRKQTSHVIPFVKNVKIHAVDLRS